MMVAADGIDDSYGNLANSSRRKSSSALIWILTHIRTRLFRSQEGIISYHFTQS